MTRERELLERVISGDDAGDFFIGYRLYKDIETFLDQPEQEPKFNFDLERMKAAIESPISDVTVDDLAKQVKQEPVAWMNDSGGCFLFDGNKYSENWTALYTAPPKREPLTPQKISEGNQSTLNVTREAFKQGVIFAEKAHGITGVDDDN